MTTNSICKGGAILVLDGLHVEAFFLILFPEVPNPRKPQVTKIFFSFYECLTAYQIQDQSTCASAVSKQLITAMSIITTST